MATRSLHSDIYDYGLTVITTAATAGTLKMSVCLGTPATRAEAVTLYGTATNKRVSGEITMATGDVSLGNRAGGGREITVAQKTGNVAATVAAGDLAIAYYDDTRLLVVNEETSDQALTLNNPLTVPSHKIGFAPPV